MNKRLLLSFAVILSIGIVMGGLIFEQYHEQIGYLLAGPKDPLEAWSEACYIVWCYNSTHYATRNMSTNMVELLSDNASLVIQTAIDSLRVSSTTGHASGTVNLLPGYYTLDSTNPTITVGYGVTIEGSQYRGVSTIYNPNTAGKPAFNLTNGWICLKGLDIRGNSQSGAGVLISIDGAYVQIFSCAIMYHGTSGVLLDSLTGGIWNLHIDNCEITHNGNVGINFSRNIGITNRITNTFLYNNTRYSVWSKLAGSVGIAQVEFDTCSFRDEPVFVYLGDPFSFKNCQWESMSNKEALIIEASTNGQIENCYFDTADTAIKINGSSSNIGILYNRWVSCNTTIHTIAGVSNVTIGPHYQYGNLNLTANTYNFLSVGIGGAFPTTMVLEGRMFYRTDLDCLYVYNGTGWESQEVAGPAGAAGPQGAPGNATTVGGWHYLVYQNTTAAYMYGFQQGFMCMHTNHSRVLQWSIGNLTAGRNHYETVRWIGNFSIGNTILLRNWTHIDMGGSYLHSTSAKEMFKNDNQVNNTHHVRLEGGNLNGHYTGTTAIEWIVGKTYLSESYKWAPVALEIWDTNVKLFNDYGLYIDDSGGNKYDIDMKDVCYCKDAAVYLRDVWDSWFSFKMLGSGAQGYASAVYIYHCGAIHVSNFYVGTATYGVYITGDSFNVMIYNALIDNCKNSAIVLDGAVGCMFNNVEITCKDPQLPGDNVVDAVVLQQGGTQNSCNNTFCNMYIGRPAAGVMRGSERYRYAIWEENINQDYNIYCCINALDTWAGVHTPSPNSVEVGVIE